MITLIDYKAGNLTSVRKAFNHLGQQSVVTDDPALVRDAEALASIGFTLQPRPTLTAKEAK